MKLVTLLIGLCGLGFAGWLVAQEGPALVFGALAAAGWGVALVCAAHLPHWLLAARGWQLLWPAARRPSLARLSWILAVREAVNALLPVARIGGEVVSVQMLIKRGEPSASAVGSIVVETTLSVLSTFCFVLMGVAYLFWRTPQHGTLLPWVGGLVLSLVAIGALMALQQIGGFRLFAKLIGLVAGKHLASLVTSGKKLDNAVRAFYGRPVRVATCFIWSFVGWFVGGAELWLALYFLGHPLGFADGLMLEAMIMATGSAAFFVPASLGVQEGTLLLFGRMLGLPDETCLALALVRRARDLFLLVPILVVWQVNAGRQLLKRRVSAPDKS